MKRIVSRFFFLFLTSLIFLIFGSAISFCQTVFINELHYDNTGIDVNEGFEIFAPAGTDLSCYTIEFYNGTGGAVYGTVVLSGIVDDEGCGFGALSFLFGAGIQNGAPDGIALYNTCTSTLVQFLSYEGTFTAVGGNANGVLSTSIGVSEAGTEPVGQSLQLTGTGTTGGSFGWNAPAASSLGTINTGQDPCGCSGPVAQPTTETTADVATPACLSATINWTASTSADNVIVVISTGAISDIPTDGVAYTANSTFGSGEELVLTDGQFVCYNGSGTSILITGLSASTNYNYAIFGYDGAVLDCEENYLTGGNFGSFTTTVCSDAQISTIMVNSCSGASEGTDELIIIENGSEPINIDDMIIYLPNTTWCNSGCGTNFIVNNATYLNDLNVMAGCVPDLFVYADPIPAGATIIIFTGNPPTTVLDYSANCGGAGAPMYAIFLDNNSITGNFANSGATPKITTIDFGNGQTDVVTYLPDDVDGVDGGSVLFDDAGNPTYYTSTGCVYPLSVRLISFTGIFEDGKNKLEWSSASESNSDFYEVQRSTNGIDFENIGTVKAAGNSDFQIDYFFEDEFSESTSVYYYRLMMVDLDHVATYSEIISVVNQPCLIYFSDDKLNVNVVTKTTVANTLNIYSTDGQLIFSQQIIGDVQIPFYHSGLFIVEIPELRFRQKIVCL